MIDWQDSAERDSYDEEMERKQTETLADRLRELARELGELVEANERMENFFRDDPYPNRSYAAHHQGRAEGYAYVVKRLLALLDDRDAKAGH